MWSNLPTNPNPAPVSFNNFSFSFSRPSLLQRLGMDRASNLLAPNGDDGLAIPASSDTSNHLAAESISNTIPLSSTGSLSVPPPNVMPQQNSIIASQPTNANPVGTNIGPISPSDVPMEIDGRASPDAGADSITSTVSSGSRVPEIYRSLSPTNYFVAPPNGLPYPRSPVRQFPEGHLLHTQPSIFGYLPRIPPRSPRLDPLAVLELESARERSEWDQVRKDLGRPSRPTSPVFRAAPVPIDVSALPRSNNPSSAVDPSFIAFSESGYESESSDAELRVFDNDDETSTTSHPTAGTRPTLVPLGVQPRGGTGPIVVPPGPTITSVPNLNGRLSGAETSLPQPTHHAGGPPYTPPPKDRKGKSPGSDTPTPAKRKFGDIEQQAHQSTKDVGNKAVDRPSEARAGVPPPLRLQVDRISASQSGTPTPPPSVPSTARPTPATATGASIDPVGGSSTAPRTGSVPANSTSTTVIATPTTRNICKFHNRPPGRVCVRKEACPDLHEGPLQAPAPYMYLQSSTPPLTTPPATGRSTPAIQPPLTIAPATGPAPVPSAPKATPAKTIPNTPTASAIVGPPQGVTAPAPAPSSVPSQTGPSRATRSQAGASKPTWAPTAAPNPSTAAATDSARAPSKESRRSPFPCRFYSTPKGCGKGAKCPFKHGDKNVSESNSGQTSNSTTPQPVRSGDASSSQAPVPTPGPSQVTLAQPNGPGPQTRKASLANILKPAPNHPLPPKPISFINSDSEALPPQEFGVVQSTNTNAQASPPNQNTEASQPAKTTNSQASTTKIKVEDSSPGPSLTQNAPVPQVSGHSTARPAPVTREIKQEDVTLYDIGQADEEIADNTAQASLRGESILPTSLTAPTRAPGVSPSASSLPAAQQAAPLDPAVSIHARISPPQTTGQPAAPPATSVIPVAPPRPSVNGQSVNSNAPAPPANQRSVSSSNTKPLPPTSSHTNGPPVSQTARVPEARREPDRRELLTRLRDPPPERRRVESGTYRPAYQDQPRLPRSASRSRSPMRSRTRSISPRRGNTRTTRYRGYSPINRSPSPPRQSLYARFGGADRNPGRVERRRPRSRSRSRSPSRYGQSYTPMEWTPRSPGSRNRSPPSSRSRSRSPAGRTSYNNRGHDYRGATTRAPISQNRSPPPQRTVAPAPRDGYASGSAYFPPENNIPRAWERNQNSGTTSMSGAGEPANATRGAQDARYPRTSKPRLVDMFEQPSGSSTPGGPRPTTTYAQNNPAPILDDGYDHDHSRTMDISPPDSPIPQHRPQDRLQDRINPPSGYHTPTESGGTLLTRMTQDIEPPALLERVSSARGPPPSRAPQRGAAPSGNRTQRAPARHPGENAPPLSHRLMDERASYPDYYNQPVEMNPPHRNSDVIGGTLMARMVGRTAD